MVLTISQSSVHRLSGSRNLEQPPHAVVPRSGATETDIRFDYVKILCGCHGVFVSPRLVARILFA